MKKKNIIIRPILTEKISVMGEEQGKYAFVVSPDANKIEIKKAIEDRFKVSVKDVATMNRKGKVKSMTVRSGGRVIRTEGARSDWKKAIVTLAEGNRIDFFEGETAV
ncbi:MAG: 50S ribosomal protein L23 [Candidatus Marinimicrobia bacterium]|nr:50S ribosomal protein L23 [Candidatus Neomarinimicrobiota bacterium]